MKGKEWEYLAPCKDSWRQQLYFKNSKLKASDVYHDVTTEEMSLEECAENWDLSIEQVAEAIEYCKANQELLALEASKDREYSLIRKQGNISILERYCQTHIGYANALAKMFGFRKTPTRKQSKQFLDVWYKWEDTVGVKDGVTVDHVFSTIGGTTRLSPDYKKSAGYLVWNKIFNESSNVKSPNVRRV